MGKQADNRNFVDELANDPERLEKLVGDYQVLKESIEANPLPYAVFDRSDKLLVWNNAYENLHKEAFDSLKHKLEKRRLKYEDIVRVTAQRNLETGEVAGYVEDRVKEHGEAASDWIDKKYSDAGWHRVTSFATPNGAVTELAVSIDQLKQREKELEETKADSEAAQARLHEAISTLDDGFVIFDKQDRLVVCNDTFRSQFGEGAKYLVEGDTYRKMTMSLALSGAIPGVEGREEQFVDELVKKRRSEVSFEKTFEAKDGKWIRQRDKLTPSGDLVGLRTDITELKKREIEIEETSRLLAETADVMKQGLIVSSAEKIEFINPKARDMVGIPAGVLDVGKPWRDMIKYQYERGDFGEGETAEKIYQSGINFLETGKIDRIERKSLDGRDLLIDRIPNAMGGITAVYTDITEVKRREAEVEKTSRLLAETSDVMVQGLLVLGKKDIEFVNPTAREFLGVPDTVLSVGKPWRDLFEFQRERGDASWEHYQGALKSYEERNIDHIERKGVNGHSLLIDRIPNSLGGITLVYTDITKLKKREAEVKAASAILRQTTDSMIQGLIVFENNIIQLYNPRASEILGLPEDVLAVGTSLEEFMDFQLERGDYGDHSVGSDYVKQRVKEINQGLPQKVERTTADGKTIRIDGIPSGAGTYILTYTDQSDIKQRETELETARMKAETAEQAKSEFLANMSHEIRTPMNGVMGMAELLASTELDAKQKMFTDVIVKSGTSLLTIINDILDFSKIDANQMELDPAPFNLAEAIEDVATLMSSKVAEKDLELVVRIKPELPQVVVGDVGRLRQIVTNLMGNAVKFTEQGHVYMNVDGKIVKTRSGESAELKFSIEDTGIGIPKDKCDQVFQKFSQVDTSATRKHEGTGLGLSIAHSLVKLMGGEMGVESEDGKGSSFWFTLNLPVSHDDEQDATDRHESGSARILVVDDNPLSRHALTEQLSYRGLDCAAASCGEEALAIMHAALDNSINIDQVIIDYQMPGMNGAELLEKMNRDERLQEIPAIVLISVDCAATTQKLAQLGTSATLVKPMRSSLLTDTIEEIMSHPKNVTAPVVTHAQMTKVAKPVEADAASPVAPNGNRSRHLDILLAEDNEVNQIVLRQILESTDFSFEIVENGKLVLEAYQKKCPGIILMDVSMPEMNGKEAASIIRRIERENNYTHTPIIGITAHALKGDRESCLEAGMDDYLPKPVSPAKLREKIEHWLEPRLKATIRA